MGFLLLHLMKNIKKDCSKNDKKVKEGKIEKRQ